METVKKTSEYVIVKKRNGRYGVRTRKSRNWINGEEKVKILLAEGLIKAPEPKAEEPAEEPAEEAAEAAETEQEATEEASAEDSGEEEPKE